MRWEFKDIKSQGIKHALPLPVPFPLPSLLTLSPEPPPPPEEPPVSTSVSSIPPVCCRSLVMSAFSCRPNASGSGNTGSALMYSMYDAWGPSDGTWYMPEQGAGGCGQVRTGEV